MLNNSLKWIALEGLSCLSHFSSKENFLREAPEQFVGQFSQSIFGESHIVK